MLRASGLDLTRTPSPWATATGPVAVAATGAGRLAEANTYFARAAAFPAFPQVLLLPLRLRKIVG